MGPIPRECLLAVEVQPESATEEGLGCCGPVGGWLFCCILCNLILPMQDRFWKASRRKCVGVFLFLFGSMRAEMQPASFTMLEIQSTSYRVQLASR